MMRGPGFDHDWGRFPPCAVEDCPLAAVGFPCFPVFALGFVLSVQRREQRFPDSARRAEDSTQLVSTASIHRIGTARAPGQPTRQR